MCNSLGVTVGVMYRLHIDPLTGDTTVIRLTVAMVRQSLKRIGVTIRKNQFGEYRVNLAAPHGNEQTAYYTTDLQDALATGHAMRMIDME